jgi:hypothetical protein
MSIIKLAIYGGIGYLIYQTFFAEGAGQGGSGIGNTLRSAAREVGDAVSGGRGGGGGGQSQSAGGTRMTGGGQGRMEQTGDASGESVSHRVGRGVM